MSRVLHTADGPWSTGAARYHIEHLSGGHTLVVAARCRLGSLAADDLALLDTGAQWSVIGGDLAELLEDDLGDLGQPMTISTRRGTMDGHLRPLSVTLVANEGDDLELAATVLVAPEWDGPVVLGYRGLLERVRVALDPGIADDDQWLMFGPAGG